MDDVIVTTGSSGDGGLRQEVQGLLRTYNAARGVGSPDAVALTAVARTAAGVFLGACVAETYWGWLVVDVLAVDEGVRGQGLGGRLIDEIEIEARVRGCNRAQTTAYDFQGLGFWLKRGYASVGEITDFPRGHTSHWLTRDL